MDEDLKFAWIGLSDQITEGSFLWESGDELNSELAGHWRSNSPDNHGGDEHCVVITPTGMGDARCTNDHGFVCQKNNDGKYVNCKTNQVII